VAHWPPESFRVLAETTKISTPIIGYGAAEVLAAAGKRAVPALLKTVREPKARISWRAVWSLGMMGPEAADAVEALKEELAWRRDKTHNAMTKKALSQIEKK
jgi:HEAT repeat protein